MTYRELIEAEISNLEREIGVLGSSPDIYEEGYHLFASLETFQRILQTASQNETDIWYVVKITHPDSDSWPGPIHYRMIDLHGNYKQTTKDNALNLIESHRKITVDMQHLGIDMSLLEYEIWRMEKSAECVDVIPYSPREERA